MFDLLYSDSILSIQEDDNGKFFLDVNSSIDEITKDDLLELYNDIKKEKPIQFSVNEFCFRRCEDGGCLFEGVIHVRQHFCPLCYHLMETIKEDANEGYDSQIQMWMKEKNFIERIVNGDLVAFVNKFNKTLRENQLAEDNMESPEIGKEEDVDE